MRKRYVDHYSGIGGQAVIEGIMMKNGDKYSVAVRTPEGDINVSLEEYELELFYLLGTYMILFYFLLA